MKQTTSFRPKWRVLTSHVIPLFPDPNTSGPDNKLNLFLPYLIASIMVFGLTLIFWHSQYIFTPVNIALLYLLPVLVTAVRWGLWPSVYAAADRSDVL
ncbi:DUF4118 domain-containing protein [Alicyclobacillus sacchari]|uniref:DUF4118 domain-containing protein n=1 Tax=Alicyclobacillus sacchari TaxID=392010 RepID=UPI0024E09714|nr:DUF4118 domain-containing protein [Alicyclobacillus sacchari]